MTARPVFRAVLRHDEDARDRAVLLPAAADRPSATLRVPAVYADAAAFDVYEFVDDTDWPTQALLTRQHDPAHDDRPRRPGLIVVGAPSISVDYGAARLPSAVAGEILITMRAGGRTGIRPLAKGASTKLTAVSRRSMGGLRTIRR